MSGATKLAATPGHAEELDGESIRRVVAVTALIGIAVIHLMDVPDTFEEVPYIGWLFIGLIVACLVLAEVLTGTTTSAPGSRPGSLPAARWSPTG